MRLKLVKASLTRPDNSGGHTYADGDVISAAGTSGSMLKFEGIAMLRDDYNPTGALITQAALIKGSDADALEADLYLFSEEITLPADSAPFAPTLEELESLVGVISFPEAEEVVGSTAGDGASYNVQMGLRIAAPCDLYGVLVARNAYQALDEEVIHIKLGVIRNFNS